jgi:hypothetical protein
MAEEVQWTRQQQANTLAAIDVVREVIAGGELHGAISGALEVLGNVSDVDDPSADLADLVAGLSNLAVMLVEHIERSTGASSFDTLLGASQVVRDVKLID